MPNGFALGTITDGRVPSPDAADRHPTDGGGDHDLSDLGRVTTPVLIQRLLEPQHDMLRSTLRGLRDTAAGLARRDRSRSHVLRRASAMIDELSDVMTEQFEHEERSVFPFLQAGVAPIHRLGAIHDHHDDIAGRLRRLWALTAELEPSRDHAADHGALLEGLDALEGLFRRHRQSECEGLLARYS